MTATGAFTLGWETGHAAWSDAARFFARNISRDAGYISHGEIQTGLSLDGKTWIPNLEQRFLAEVETDTDERSLAVARDAQGKIVGAASVSWSFEVPEAAFATLQDLAIEADIQSKGLGAQLLAFVERHVWDRGAKWLFLESGLGNTRAHAFFERGGFHPVSHVFAKRPPGQT